MNMKGNTIITVALVAGGAYLGYRYAVQNLMIPDYLGIMGGEYPRTQDQLNATVAALAAGSGVSAGGGVVAGGGGSNGVNVLPSGSGASNQTTTPAPATPTLTTPSSVAEASVKDQLWNAAKGEANPNNGRLHFWQWNYHLPTGVARLDPFAVSDAAWSGTPLGRKPISENEVRDTKLTLDQYWSLVSPQLGLSGMGNMAMNSWSGQPSVWSGRASGGWIQ